MGPGADAWADGGGLTPRVRPRELSRDELKTHLRPGFRLLVAFTEDSGFFHERIIGAEAFPGQYVIRTGSGDEYIEDFRCWAKAFC